MRDALKSYLSLATGMTELTRQRAVAAAKGLVAQGEATAGQVTELAEDLLEQSRQNREAVTALVRFEVDRALGRVGLATQDEVEQLRAKVRLLESQLAGGGTGTSATRGGTSASAPAPAKADGGAAARKTAKAPAKKAARSAAKKAGA